ncbi:hypothetical protein LCGC14_0592430 [marine sediment metagenome]|uniref:CBM-cenC domain-containing protein n=1 Tax=marine sediment metagenome TaxID=412755 RepID=A0A0F9RD23_9ZZZZ
MAVPTPGSAEAITYAQASKTDEARVVLSVSYPLWDAEVSDIFDAASLDLSKWWSTFPTPDQSGEAMNLRVFGLPPFELVASHPLWMPTLEDIGFQIFIDVAFPDVTPGYHQMLALVALEGGRGKDSAPMVLHQRGEDTAGPGEAAGELMLAGTNINAQTEVTTNPQGSHRYRFEWDPTAGADGGGQITIDLDGTQIFQFDNTDVTDPLEPNNSRVANANCVRPYMIVAGFIAKHNDDVDTPSGTAADPQVTLRLEDVTCTALDTVDATETLTLTGQPGDGNTVSIDGKVYTFQTALTDADGNVLISAVDASGSLDNLIAAITLGDGAGTAYATSMTRHLSCTAAAGAGDTMDVVARVPGTAGNSFVLAETLVSGSWGGGAVLLSGGVDGTAYETRVWPGWTSVNAGGGLDDAVVGERFDLDGETWAKLPNLRSLTVVGGRDQQSDSLTVLLAGGDPADPSNANVFQGSFATGMLQDRMGGRPILIDTRVLRDDATATAWKRQIAGIVEDVSTALEENGATTITITGRDRMSVKLDVEISRSYIAVAGDATRDTPALVNAGFDLDSILQDIVDLADLMWTGDVLGATDTSINTSVDIQPDILTVGPNLLAATTSLADESGFEMWRRYTTSGTGRYGELVIARWTLGPEHGIASDVYGPFPRFLINGPGATEANNARNIRLAESRTGGVGHVSVHSDSMLNSTNNLSALGGEPGPADFPMLPYPPSARELRTSLPYGGVIGFATVFWKLRDQFGNVHLGGTGLSRYRRENVNRRAVTVTIEGHDWVEITDPIEIDDPDHTGLVPATMAQLHANPSLETDTTGYSVAAAGTNTIDRNATQAKIGGWSLRHVRNDAGVDIQSRFAATLTAAQHVFSVFVWLPTNWDWGVPELTFSNYGGSTIDHVSVVDTAIRDRWQRVFVTATIVGGDLIGDLEVKSSGAGTAGRVFYVDGLQLELGEYPTAYADGTLPGVAWSGTPHLSASDRVGELFVVNDRTLTHRNGNIETTLKIVTAQIEEATRRIA